ncbi:uncharacterized protein HD556DRAFT_1302881 [Suillus plorans]|uniref:Zn(2)-C6 fungal-type domain-containing protein n=1 Tax=Suillus plorans TaxID=116603 RepID=A0A9P7DY80_9AGAM|nr:uncharacterized protein HD556DRAFT_1302881 [Suillus plorans]KAG1806394.1 hypothetical protein HD556DRAFT_1302881 [Suillus plorans]
MTPSEEANAALNDTLKDLKEGDSATALALLDEIARRLAKDLKLYGGSATSFSPQLLSCAAVVRQYAKGGMFTSSPDWTTIGDNDPCIKDHPCFQKTIHYRAPTGSDKTEPDLASLAQMDVQQAVLSFPSLDGPKGSPIADVQTPVKLLPHTEKPQDTISLQTFGAMAPHSPPPTLTKALEPLTPLPSSMAPTKTPEQTVLTWDPKTREKTHRQHRNDKKRQPAKWGQDSQIATLWKCDKCTKLDIPCIVLPDKKFGYTRLACANCDQMKITCAIDGVGVRQRMQAKAAAATSQPARNSRTRMKTSCAISKTPEKPGPPAGVPMSTVPTVGTSRRPEQGNQPALENRTDPEPTARDILQGIRDLGRRLDLLATNERVDALEVRVHSVENVLHQRLDALEQRLNASDAR